MTERQELFCHDCGNYVQFDVDLSLDGNHVFKCPKCEHEHCRVVKDGKITDIRWAQRNGPTYQINCGGNITYSTASVYVTSTASSTPLTTAWMGTTSANNTGWA